MSNNLKRCLNCNPGEKLNEDVKGLKEWDGYYNCTIDIIEPDATRRLNICLPDTDWKSDLENDVCPFCKSHLIDIGITRDEFFTIAESSNYNRAVVLAMIDLKQKDPIEYQLKLNQFEIQYNEKKKMKSQTKSSYTSSKPTVSCPYCKSTNTTKITATSKAVSVAVWGIFSRKVHKQWHCNSCKSDF